MSDGLKLTGNLITVALLVIAVLAIVNGLRLEEHVCLDTTSSFHGSQCPTSEDADESANVLRVSSNTTMDTDHPGQIVIDSDGVTLDCASHEIRGAGPIGIAVSGRSDVTIRGCRVTGFVTGIALSATSNSRVVNNVLAGSSIGISLSSSHGNEIRGNDTHLLQTAFALAHSDSNDVVDNSAERGNVAVAVRESSENSIRRNTVRSAVHAIWVTDGAGNTVADNQLVGGDGGAGGIRIWESDRIRAIDNEITGVSIAIDVRGEWATVAGNHIENASTGVSAVGSNHTVQDNTVDVGQVGISLNGSDHLVTGNQVEGGSVGIKLRKTFGSTLTENHVTRSAIGLQMDGSRNNTLRDNDVSGAGKGLDGLAVRLNNNFELNTGLGLAEPLIVAVNTTLSADYEGVILVGADDVTLDCAGNRVLAPDWHVRQSVRIETGITIDGRSGVTVRNCELVGFDQAFTLWDTDTATLEDNSGSVVMNRSHRNDVIRHNAESMSLFGSNHNTIGDTHIVGGEIRLKRSNRNRIVGNSLPGEGIAVWSSNNNVIAENQITEGRIHMRSSDRNTVRANTITREDRVCFLIGQQANNNIIEGNTAVGGRIGFLVHNSEGNTLSGNTADAGKWGFRLVHDRGTNTVTDNVGF